MNDDSESRTSVSWWASVRRDEAAFHAWLLDQYRGESTAAARIEALRDRYAGVGPRARRTLTVIAAQERKHARWVGALLAARGVVPVVESKTERYWSATLPGVRDFATGCAVGAHAERMRLARIEVIAADADAPADVRAVFARILREERFHERAFRALAGAAALERTRDAHALGRAALGLVA